MSATGATGPQKTQTELEMEAGRKALERYAAQRLVPVVPKTATGATGFGAKDPTGNTGATRPAKELTGPTGKVIPFDWQNAKPAAALSVRTRSQSGWFCNRSPIGWSAASKTSIRGFSGTVSPAPRWRR